MKTSSDPSISASSTIGTLTYILKRRIDKASPHAGRTNFCRKCRELRAEVATGSHEGGSVGQVVCPLVYGAVADGLVTTVAAFDFAPALPHNSRPSRGAIAQLGERLHGMQEVDGSIPSGSTNFPRRRLAPMTESRPHRLEA